MDDEKSSKNQKRVNQDFKQEQLEQYRMSDYGQPMTTQEGKKITGSGSIKSRYPWTFLTSGL